MPTPRLTDPLRCAGSHTVDFEERPVPHQSGQVWGICHGCVRVIHLRANATLRLHRVRCENTRSLDLVRDVLAGVDEHTDPATLTGQTALTLTV